MIKNIRNKVDKLTIEKRAFINGSFVESVNGEIIKKVSPIDGRIFPEFAPAPLRIL